MGWFTSKQDENNEAYAKGVEAGKSAGAIEYFVHDIGNAIHSNFGKEATEDSSYNAGFEEGYSKK